MKSSSPSAFSSKSKHFKDMETRKDRDKGLKEEKGKRREERESEKFQIANPLGFFVVHTLSHG